MQEMLKALDEMEESKVVRLGDCLDCLPLHFETFLYKWRWVYNVVVSLFQIKDLYLNTVKSTVWYRNDTLSPGQTRMRVDASWCELQVSLAFDRQLASTRINFELSQILMQVNESFYSFDRPWELHESCQWEVLNG